MRVVCLCTSYALFTRGALHKFYPQIKLTEPTCDFSSPSAESNTKLENHDASCDAFPEFGRKQME